jgi:hypothetical protein
MNTGAIELWEAIRDAKICERAAVAESRFEGILVARPKRKGEWGWLIGPYDSLTRLATTLRTDPDLRAEIADRGVRFGAREGDVTWKDDVFGRELQKRIGPRNNPAQSDYTGWRTETLHQPLIAAPPACRQSDQYDNVKSFWETQTLQSHHLVEHATLKRLGVSRDDMDDDFHHNKLPCVLLVGELHQRYVTAFLREQRDLFRPGMSSGEAFQALQEVFGSMYGEQGKLFLPLHRIAEKVNEAARDFLAQSQPTPKGKPK